MEPNKAGWIGFGVIGGAGLVASAAGGSIASALGSAVGLGAVGYLIVYGIAKVVS